MDINTVPWFVNMQTFSFTYFASLMIMRVIVLLSPFMEVSVVFCTFFELFDLFTILVG